MTTSWKFYELNHRQTNPRACNFMLRLRRTGDVVEFLMPTLSSIVLPLKFINLRESHSISNMNLIKYLKHVLLCTVRSHFYETFVITNKPFRCETVSLITLFLFFGVILQASMKNLLLLFIDAWAQLMLLMATDQLNDSNEIFSEASVNQKWLALKVLPKNNFESGFFRNDHTFNEP